MCNNGKGVSGRCHFLANFSYCGNRPSYPMGSRVELVKIKVSTSVVKKAVGRINFAIRK
jgi:hypothetical protein